MTRQSRLQQQLYHAFGLQLLYNREDQQVTCRATITPATPAALAAILNDSEHPASHPTRRTGRRHDPFTTCTYSTTKGS